MIVSNVQDLEAKRLLTDAMIMLRELRRNLNLCSHETFNQYAALAREIEIFLFSEKGEEKEEVPI